MLKIKKCNSTSQNMIAKKMLKIFMVLLILGFTSISYKEINKAYSLKLEYFYISGDYISMSYGLSDLFTTSYVYPHFRVTGPNNFKCRYSCNEINRHFVACMHNGTPNYYGQAQQVSDGYYLCQNNGNVMFSPTTNNTGCNWSQGPHTLYFKCVESGVGTEVVSGNDTIILDNVYPSIIRRANNGRTGRELTIQDPRAGLQGSTQQLKYQQVLVQGYPTYCPTDLTQYETISLSYTGGWTGKIHMNIDGPLETGKYMLCTSGLYDRLGNHQGGIARSVPEYIYIGLNSYIEINSGEYATNNQGLHVLPTSDLNPEYVQYSCDKNKWTDKRNYFSDSQQGYYIYLNDNSIGCTTQTGVKTVYAKFINTNNTVIGEAEDTIIYDKRFPIIVATHESGSSEIQISIQDDLSGLSGESFELKYGRMDSGVYCSPEEDDYQNGLNSITLNYEEGSLQTQTNININNDYTKHLCMLGGISDLAGNISPGVYGYTPPVINISGQVTINNPGSQQSAAFTNNTVLSLKLYSHNANKYRISCDQETWSDTGNIEGRENYKTTTGITITLGEGLGCDDTSNGTKQVYVEFINDLIYGTQSIIAQNSIFYDADKPIINAEKIDGNIVIWIRDVNSGLTGTSQTLKYLWTDSDNCDTAEASYNNQQSFGYSQGTTELISINNLTEPNNDGTYKLCVYSGIYDRAMNSSDIKDLGQYCFGENCDGNTEPIELKIICTEGSAHIDEQGQLSVIPPENSEGEAICAIEFQDDEGSIVTGYVSYEFDTRIITPPTITLHTDELYQCSNTKHISGTVTSEGNYSFHYAISDSGNCDQSLTNVTRNGYDNGTNIELTGAHSNKYICFRAVNQGGTGYSGAYIHSGWFDYSAPEVTFNDTGVYECSAGFTWSILAYDIGCAGNNGLEYMWSNSFGNSNRTQNSGLNITSLNIGRTGNTQKTQQVEVKDRLGNISSTTTKSLTINDIPPTLDTGVDVIQGVLSGTYTYGNVINKLGAKEQNEHGNCGTGDLTATLISCTNATGNINNNKVLTISGNTNLQTTGQCTIEFRDNENSVVTGYVQYTIDTQAPIITITGPSESCATGKTVSATMNESGTMYYSTGTSGNCTSANKQYTGGTAINFTHESDNGTYVCFKAVDSVGNTSYSGSLMITGIDKSAPSFELSGNFNNNTNNIELYECETGSAQISSINDNGCFGSAGILYSRSGQNYGNINYFNIYRESVGSQTIDLFIKDAGQNETGTSITFSRQDRKITFSGSNETTSEINLHEITDNITIDPISAISGFNLTGWGSCETIQITTGTCTNATQILNGTFNNYTLTIQPKDNTDATGQCIITFKDISTNDQTGDSTLTGIIKFHVKTKKYYMVIDYETGTEKGHIYNTGELDTGKITLGGTVLWENITGQIKRDSLKIDANWQGNSNKEWPTKDEITITIKDIEFDDNVYDTCASGQYTLTFDTGFVVDPAGNPSEKTTITTDQVYKFWIHLFASGGNNAFLGQDNNNFGLTQKTLIDSGFDIDLYATADLGEGTGRITCVGNTLSCPGFSCDEIGISGHIESSSPMNPLLTKKDINYHHKHTLHIDAFEPEALGLSGDGSDLEGNQVVALTGCIIKLNSTCNAEEITINIVVKTSPYKVGSIRSEDFYDSSLGSGIAEGSGDNGFFFYISHPQYIQVGGKTGVLGGINYDINFSEPVADEFYHIEGNSIVNGYQETLKIKRPTYNYENPRSYLFNFPYY